jgi:phosphoadenosine phosphosulfate reductase
MLDTHINADSDLTAINAALADKSPQEIIAWAVGLGKRTFMTTTFGDHSAAILHMVTRIVPNIQILWVDTGYNSSATYRFAEKLIGTLNLNVDIYTPLMSSARRNVLMKGIPEVGEPLHEEFTRQVKLEPFQRAIDKIKPQVWITGLRSEQTSHRKNLDIVSRTQEGYLKVAPIMGWSEAHINAYLADNKLPNEADYYDPTKGQESRECGLHTKF